MLNRKTKMAAVKKEIALRKRLRYCDNYVGLALASIWIVAGATATSGGCYAIGLGVIILLITVKTWIPRKEIRK